MRKIFTSLLLASSITSAYAATATTTSATTSSLPAVVEIQTNFGSFTIQLNHDKAPITSKNFLDYVNSGFYKNTYFHRVVRSTEKEPNIDILQGGGYELPSAKLKPTNAPIINESSNGLLNKEGTLSMARTSEPNSATSQFFINFFDNPELDKTESNPGYAVFADVISGLDLIKAIGATNLVPFDPLKPNEGTPRAGFYDCGFNYCMKKIYIENVYLSPVVDKINSITRVTVNGNGKVISEPKGIACVASSKSCVVKKPFGTPVSLTATPTKGYEFKGWSGDCLENTTHVELDTKAKNNNCTATFAKKGA